MSKADGIDVERVRGDTPATSHLVHLNNAGSSPTPTPVLNRVIDHLRLESSIGGYEAATRSQEAGRGVYGSLATLLGCDEGELALTENASRAWLEAIHALRFQEGDRILVSSVEYATSGIALAQLSQRKGVVVEVLADDEYGQVSCEALERAIDERVKLVAITHVPSQGGLVNPVAAVGAITRAAGVPFLLDACQSVGQLRVDVESIGCDLLALTGRKFLRAPRGTGALYVRDSMIGQLEPAMYGNGGAVWTGFGTFEPANGARRFELFESSVAARIGLGAAVEYALDVGLDQIAGRVGHLARYLRSGLAALDGVEVNDRGLLLSGIVTFSVRGHDPDEVKAFLASRSVNVEVARREHAYFDFAARHLDSLVRASVHYFTTEAELDRLLTLLDELAPR